MTDRGRYQIRSWPQLSWWTWSLASYFSEEWVWRLSQLNVRPGWICMVTGMSCHRPCPCSLPSLGSWPLVLQPSLTSGGQHLCVLSEAEKTQSAWESGGMGFPGNHVLPGKGPKLWFMYVGLPCLLAKMILRFFNTVLHSFSMGLRVVDHFSNWFKNRILSATFPSWVMALSHLCSLH